MLQTPLDNNESIIDLTIENFQTTLTETSTQKLVLVYCWAEAVPESLSMMQDLERIATENANDLLLAKVDCQAQQQIAMQFGIQQIPTLILFKDGQPVDGFSGVQPLDVIQAALEKHLPKPEEILLQQAGLFLQSQQYKEAYQPLMEANQLAPENVAIQKALADVMLNTGKTAEAEAILSNIKMIDQDDYYHTLMAKLELNQQAADTPEIQALEGQLAAQPGDIDIIIKLAVQLHQVQRNEDALVRLFAVLKLDLNAADGEAKRIFMDIVQTLPEGDALASQYRRKLYSLLY